MNNKKICNYCSKEEISNNLTYCLSCREIVDKTNRDKANRKKNIIARKKIRDNLKGNFYFIDPAGQNLLPKNFNRISEFTARSYSVHYQSEWSKVLKRYDKYEEYISLLISEFFKWQKENNSQNLTSFGKHIGLSSSTLRNYKDFVDGINYTPNRYTNDMFHKEFNRVVEHFGRVPSKREFEQESAIKLVSFVNYFGLKGEWYRELLEFYDFSCEDIEEANLRNKKAISESFSQLLIGKPKYSEEVLEREFRRVCDEHIDRFGEFPTMRIFEANTSIGTTTYSSRYNMTYLEIAESFGYSVDKTASGFEFVVLETIKQILQEDYLPQARFEWLKSESDRWLRCDGYFENYSLIIEADGEQHFRVINLFGQESFDRTQANDQIKNTLIPQHNLTLLRIAYDEPYYDLDFLRFKLIEHGIIPPSHNVLNDSIQTIKNAS